MDNEVKHTVRKIFEDLRKSQPITRSRKSDRINVDKILSEFHEKNFDKDLNK